MASLKEQIRYMRHLCTRLDKTPLGLYRRSAGKITMNASFDCDMLLYGIALSNGDGKIDIKEARKISEVLGFNVGKEKMQEFVKEQGIWNHRLDDGSIPLTMQALVDADQDIMQRRFESYRDGSREDDGKIYVPISIRLYEIYKTIGEAIIYSDDQVDERENEDYVYYLWTLKKYICDELSFQEEEFKVRQDILEDN